MGYSGLIYAVIVAAWAAVLVPRWVRRNEEVERAREADTIRGVRVLQRRAGRGHAPHEIAVPVDRVPDQDLPIVRVEDDRVATARRGAGAASRRRRILVALVSLYVAASVAAVTGRVPSWLPLATLLLVVAFLFLARRAAVAEARQRRLAARRPSRAGAASRGVHRALAAARSQPALAAADEGSAGLRRLVVPDELIRQPDADDSWQPVPVPLPTYVTKPKAPRVARKIDLSTPGAWTSGRLDPASPVVLPHRNAVGRVSGHNAAGRRAVGDDVQVGGTDAEADELPEQRRAIGD